MEDRIAKGRTSAVEIYSRVQKEIPEDQLAVGRALAFAPSDKGLELATGGTALVVHKHALAQLAGKASIPAAYLNDLVNSEDGWKQSLASHILGKHYGEITGESANGNTRFLLRSVNGSLRGFLSDRYRRLDSRPILESFIDACKTVGAVPVNGTGSDTRITMKAILPMVFEPVENEVLCLGVEWANSDFGAGKLTLRSSILRLWCTNHAVLEDTLSEVHLGGRLSDDDIQFSAETYASDTKTRCLAVRDAVGELLAPKKVNAVLESIKRADEAQVDWREFSRSGVAKRLLKGELKAVQDSFEGQDVVNLPPGKSIWRVSNAISWLAGASEDNDRKLELQRLAGEVLAA